MLAQRVKADVVDEDLEQMPHGDGARRVAHAVGGERLVDVGRQLLRLPDVGVRARQVDVTGAAGRHERVAAVLLLLCEGEVAAHQGLRAQRADAHVLGGAAAVPVVELGQADVEDGQDRLDGVVVGTGGAVHRAARVVEVLPHQWAPPLVGVSKTLRCLASSSSPARARMALRPSTPLMRCGRKPMRPLVTMPMPDVVMLGRRSM